MLATLIIVFREIIEAGLVVGIVLAATRGVESRGYWVGYGILAGISGSCVVAAFANSISNALQGVGQELFNVTILTVAVIMLTWHNVWMARQGRQITGQMKELGVDVATGRRSLVALSIVIGIAVLREGSELVLFLYGIAISGGENSASMAIGGISGIAFGVAASALMYFGLLKIHTRNFFKVTSWLIAMLAAGMAAQAAAFLQQAQLVNAFSQMLWDSSNLISNSSVAGKVLHALIGYTDKPTMLQLIVYSATLAMIVVLMRIFGSASHKHKRSA
jgi:high-affinity iron transporter